MNSRTAVLAVLIVACVFVVTVSGGDDGFWLRECDSRCEIRNRLSPFQASCDDCCRGRGFSKGKCKGFGWQYCMCKQNAAGRLLNAILNG